MAHIASRSDTRAFSAPIGDAVNNPAAHGNVRITEYCLCGAIRHCNVNGREEEQGPWDMPHERANIAAVWVTLADCKRYLEIAAESHLGREIIIDLCGPEGGAAIINAPYRGDAESTLDLARRVHARLG